MKIGPVQNDQPTPGRTQRVEPKAVKGPKAEPAGDQVEISTEARMKLAALADRALYETFRGSNQPDPQTSVDSPQPTGVACKTASGHNDRNAKLTRAQQRIDSGFYDQPGIREQIADRLATELKKLLK